jgi:hypothetical protein
MCNFSEVTIIREDVPVSFLSTFFVSRNVDMMAGAHATTLTYEVYVGAVLRSSQHLPLMNLREDQLTPTTFL